MFLSFTVGLGVAAWRSMSSLNYLSEKEAEERFGCLLSRDFADVKGSFVHESYREKTGDWDLHYIKGHNACKTVIAVPGISSHWTCVLKFLDPFFLEGWNICVFDYCPQVQQGTPNKKSGAQKRTTMDRQTNAVIFATIQIAITDLQSLYSKHHAYYSY